MGGGSKRCSNTFSAADCVTGKGEQSEDIYRLITASEGTCQGNNLLKRESAR